MPGLSEALPGPASEDYVPRRVLGRSGVLSTLRAGDALPVRARVVEWDPLFERLVLDAASAAGP